MLNISTLIYYQSSFFAELYLNCAKNDAADASRRLATVVDELLVETHSLKGAVGEPLHLAQLVSGALSVKQLLLLCQTFAFRIQNRVH
jgi:hypothetical protein